MLKAQIPCTTRSYHNIHFSMMKSMKRSTNILLISLGYLFIGAAMQIVFRDSQASPWSNLAAMAGDLPENVAGFLFSIFYLLLTVLFWPLHVLVLLFR